MLPYGDAYPCDPFGYGETQPGLSGPDIDPLTINEKGRGTVVAGCCIINEPAHCPSRSLLRLQTSGANDFGRAAGCWNPYSPAAFCRLPSISAESVLTLRECWAVVKSNTRANTS